MPEKILITAEEAIGAAEMQPYRGFDSNGNAFIGVRVSGLPEAVAGTMSNDEILGVVAGKIMRDTGLINLIDMPGDVNG